MGGPGPCFSAQRQEKAAFSFCETKCVMANLSFPEAPKILTKNLKQSFTRLSYERKWPIGASPMRQR